MSNGYSFVRIALNQLAEMERLMGFDHPMEVEHQSPNITVVTIRERSMVIEGNGQEHIKMNGERVKYSDFPRKLLAWNMEGVERVKV